MLFFLFLLPLLLINILMPLRVLLSADFFFYFIECCIRFHNDNEIIHSVGKTTSSINHTWQKPLSFT